METFSFTRGPNIQESHLDCRFVKNPEASKWMIDDIDMAKMQKDLQVEFIPPALQRRSEDAGIDPHQYVLEAFMKGKVYSQVYRSSVDLNNKNLAEMGFVLKCNASLRKLMVGKEKENGEIDWADLQKAWDIEYPNLLKEELRLTAAQQAPPPPPKAPQYPIQ